MISWYSTFALVTAKRWWAHSRLGINLGGVWDGDTTCEIHQMSARNQRSRWQQRVRQTTSTTLQNVMDEIVDDVRVQYVLNDTSTRRARPRVDWTATLHKHVEITQNRFPFRYFFRFVPPSKIILLSVSSAFDVISFFLKIQMQYALARRRVCD